MLRGLLINFILTVNRIVPIRYLICLHPLPLIIETRTPSSPLHIDTQLLVLPDVQILVYQQTLLILT